DEKHNTFSSSPDIDSLITSERNSVGQSSYQSFYCESCITIPTEGMLKCQVCECRHPSGLPKVCNDLDHFLEEHFSLEYALRRNAIQLNHDQTQKENLSNESSTPQVPGPSSPTGEKVLQWQLVHGFHPVGCDMCRLRPIIGKRQLAVVSAIAARNQSIPAYSSLRLPSSDEDGVSSHSNVLSSAT
nr:hypothetical protein [Tanacetum cinerariifolium]